MSDAELVTWARTYFGAIPLTCMLPSDRRLSMMVSMGSDLTDEQRKELSWIRTLIEGDITFTRKRNKEVPIDGHGQV